MIETKLPFAPYEHFTKNSIPERQMLYQKICERIWNVDGLMKLSVLTKWTIRINEQLNFTKWKE